MAEIGDPPLPFDSMSTPKSEFVQVARVIYRERSINRERWASNDSCNDSWVVRAVVGFTLAAGSP